VLCSCSSSLTLLCSSCYVVYVIQQQQQQQQQQQLQQPDFATKHGACFVRFVEGASKGYALLKLPLYIEYDNA